MGLTLPTVKWIVQLSKLFKNSDRADISVASLGYPDLLLTPDELFSLNIDTTKLNLASDFKANSVRRWHNLADNFIVYDVNSFFEYLGMRLSSIDIKKHRGDEYIADLGILGSVKSLEASFDLVIDNGTLEHCFNIANSFMNVASLANEGGYVLHHNPLNIYNHGFWSVNPTFYSDFYTSIGFSVKNIELMSISRPWKTATLSSYTKRQHLESLLKHSNLPLNGEYAINCVVKRLTNKPIFIDTLMQSKYR